MGGQYTEGGPQHRLQTVSIGVYTTYRGVQDSANDHRSSAMVMFRNLRSFRSRVEYLAGSGTQDVSIAGE
eukprot:1177337-Prorocentrum_minimum.AAC.1